jgi:ATP-dependent helicase HrpA
MPAARKPTKTVWHKTIEFPEHLPVSERRQEIAEAIQEHQILILAGETGSGKTTQIPKLCMSLGYGTKGLIGHTQPRRIAARTVADRIAKELGTKLGDAVGYQVRFNDVSSAETRIKLMTDGVLLAELQRDRLLRRYEVIIIDEAHERSLNIDFLLGLLKPLCKKRPDLKLIITSATIDLDKFAQHFSSNNTPAPIIEVSGRTFPVQTIYQEIETGTKNGANQNLPDVISETVGQIIRNEAKGKYHTSGDILVFCAGEREIRDTAQSLRKANLQVDVLPLYSRLSISEQNKVFQKAHRRKVVLATNVAETSITVPGIAYVIDPGLARIARYSFRSKVQRLPIEAISQASANQRMGRCGRVANGVCIRLYSEQDFLARDQFTPAEILRSNLASVILKMLRLGIRDIDKFEFIDKPDKRLLNDGYKLLSELAAVDKNHKLSAYGRQMSDLPIDPKFARILIAANEIGCLRDALIVVSALSVRDPRERPADKQAAATRAHQWLEHSHSEFYSFLNLWQAINNAREELSNTKFKQLCAQRFWSIARVFEWRELYRQLATQSKSLGWNLEEWIKIELPIEGQKKPKATKGQFNARYQNIHLALISGLISNIANKDLEGKYIATRSRSVNLFPSSPNKKLKAKWLLAAELMETSQLFMLTTAEIKPQWIVRAAKHLCKYSYSDAHYDKKLGNIRANRKTLLYGLVLNDKEPINYASVKPDESNAIFVRQALTENRYTAAKPPLCLEHNAALIGEIEKIETKTRRRNLLISDELLYQFYQQRIPSHIVNNVSFEKWASNPSNDESLKLNRTDLLSNSIDETELAQFPDQITVLGKSIKIRYEFSPGQLHDGATMIIPVSVLAPFPEHIGEWLVPGLLKEKCTALIKTLPKSLRRNFAPAAQAVERVLTNLSPDNTSLTTALAEQLLKTRGVKVDPKLFDLSKLDPYYLMNYRVIDVDGSLIDQGRDLHELKKHFAHAVQTSVHADHAPARKKLEQHNIDQWDFGDIAPSVQYQHQGMSITAYPMLKIMDDGSISLIVSDNKDDANYHTQRAVLQLAKTVLDSQSKSQGYRYLRKELFKTKASKASGLSTLAEKLSTAPTKIFGQSSWTEETIMAALSEACFSSNLGNIRNAQSFDLALSAGSKKWVRCALELERLLLLAFAARDDIFSDLESLAADDLQTDSAIEDIKAQLYRMFEPHFLRYTSASELKQYPRYLRAIESRIESLAYTNKTLNMEHALLSMQSKFDSRIRTYKQELDFIYTTQPRLKEFSLLLQEWRVSIYAQHLRTQIPVSEKRLQKAWALLGDSKTTN